MQLFQYKLIITGINREDSFRFPFYQKLVLMFPQVERSRDVSVI